ncbi:MAG: ribosome-recycling factor, partial [Bacteroidota bacterium]
MLEEINDNLEMASLSMDEALDHLQRELVKIRAGKASPAMLSGINVDYYGSQTPLNQVANIVVSDSKTLSIQPWEKSMIPNIEQAIFAANIGLTPQNNGEMV